MTGINTSFQTYQGNAKIAPTANDDLTKDFKGTEENNRFTFSDLVMDKIKAPLEASRLAEQAPMLKHQGQLSQEEFSMIMNEAQVQLAELKFTAEKSITALQEVLRSTFT
jgi:hypothetical protein